MPVDIRDAQPGDASSVVGLWRACDLVRPWNDPDADLARALDGETSTVLVAHDADATVGTVMVGHDGHRGWLYYLAVDPARQGHGVGRALVVAAEAWLLARGAVKAQLMVRATNPGVLGFYEALGYSDQECVVLGRRF